MKKVESQIAIQKHKLDSEIKNVKMQSSEEKMKIENVECKSIIKFL